MEKRHRRGLVFTPPSRPKLLYVSLQRPPQSHGQSVSDLVSEEASCHPFQLTVTGRAGPAYATLQVFPFPADNNTR